MEFGPLVEEAAAWEPGVEGLTFLPYLAGERTPHADPDARGALTGLSLRHERGALVRAVLEGVACGLRDSLDLVVAMGARPDSGRVSGGGARSELWLRIIASVLELPLERLAVEEGAAYGAALLGGVAGGVFADVEEAVAACVQPRDAVEPVAEWVEPYAELRERYRALYPALQGRVGWRRCGGLWLALAVLATALILPGAACERGGPKLRAASPCRRTSPSAA